MMHICPTGLNVMREYVHTLVHVCRTLQCRQTGKYYEELVKEMQLN